MGPVFIKAFKIFNEYGMIATSEKLVKFKRENQLDLSERYIVKKERVSRNEHLGQERDSFSCPRGDMCFFNNPSIGFGTQRQEYKVAHEKHKYNKYSNSFYGKEL